MLSLLSRAASHCLAAPSPSAKYGSVLSGFFGAKTAEELRTSLATGLQQTRIHYPRSLYVDSGASEPELLVIDFDVDSLNGLRLKSLVSFRPGCRESDEL